MPSKRTNLDKHPMNAKLLEALAKGESTLSISRWLRPKVSQTTVWRYAQHKRIAMRDIADVIQAADSITKSNTSTELTRQAAKVLASVNEAAPLLARVAKRQADIDRLIGTAESTGDLKAASGLIKADEGMMRLQGELTGVIGPRAQPQNTQVNIAVIMPPPGATPLLEAEATYIDVVER